MQTKPGSSKDQVIVDVNVDEQNTGSLSFGGAYGPDSASVLNIAFSEANFLGRGQNLSFNLNTSKGSRALSFDFSDPNVLGRHLTFNLTAGYRETNDFNSSYSTKTASSAPASSSRSANTARLGLHYSASYAKIFSVDTGSGTPTGSSAILRREEALGGAWRSGIGYDYIYDTRTNGIDPRGGVYLKFGQDLTGLGGNASFIKTNVTAEAERKVHNDDVTLTATFEGGALNVLSGQTRITDRYLLGSQTLRGFALWRHRPARPERHQPRRAWRQVLCRRQVRGRLPAGPA